MNFLSNKLSGEIPKFPPKIPPQKYSITTRANIILFFRLTATCHPQTYKLQFFYVPFFLSRRSSRPTNKYAAALRLSELKSSASTPAKQLLGKCSDVRRFAFKLFR